MKDLFIANFGVLLGGFFTLVGTILGLLGGLIGPWLNHRYSIERERDQRMFQLRQITYTELLRMLDQPQSPSEFENIKDILLKLNQSMLIAGKDVLETLQKIYNDFEFIRKHRIKGDQKSFTLSNLEIANERSVLQKKIKSEFGIK